MLTTGRGGPAVRAVRIVVTCTVAAGIGAVVLVPGWEYYTQSVRAASGSWANGTEWALSVWDLPALLVPEIWGTTGIYYGPHPFRASSDYAGLVPLALAFTGAAATWRSEPRWLALALASGLLAFGPATPVGALLAHVPVFSGLRVPLRWLSFVHLAACVLAARGWEAVTAAGGRTAGGKWRSVPAFLMAGWAAVAIALAVGRSTVAEWIVSRPFAADHTAGERVLARDSALFAGSALMKGAVTAAAAAGTLGLLSVVRIPFGARAAAAWAVTTSDLLVSTAGYFVFAPAPARPCDDRVARWLAEKAASRQPGAFRSASDEYFGLPNRRMGFGLDWTGGYHGLPMDRYYQLQESAITARTVAQLSLLNVRYIVTTGSPPAGLKVAAGIEGTGGTTTIAENPAVLPRAFLARRVIRCGSMEETLAILNRPDWTPALVPVDARPAGIVPAAPLAWGGLIACEYGRDEIAARIDIPGRDPGVLVFSETWYPAWKAFLNGARVPVLRACGALRAIAIPSGRHSVRMIYDSLSFKIGLWVSAASVIFVTAVLVP
jgi:hypothetical protein